jgi:hypothetical protein
MMVSQATLLVAVQAQLAAVVTSTMPVPPAPPMVEVGGTL